jgi:soluble lytic murein transglycosylase-like protein
MLLHRRNGMRFTHLSCRNKGKVVIRVGKIIPPQAGVGRLESYSRKVLTVMAFAASLAAFALIVDKQHGWSWFIPAPEQPSPETLAAAETGTGTPALSPAEENRYRALGDFVSRKYRVSQDVAFDLVSLAHSVGHQLGLDPLLIIAVIAIESRFNPIAESVAGAKGLMQIIPKYHVAKLEEYGGEKAVFDPVANVKIGALILKDYIRVTGNVGIALQMYAGALGDGEDQYTTKVMNEQQRLRQVLSVLPRSGFTRTASSATPHKTSLD